MHTQKRNTFLVYGLYERFLHFDYEEIKTAFKEIKRALKDNGQFLFSFHVGNNLVHLDDFLDHQVNIDFYFLETNKITDLLIETDFEIIDIIERQSYKDAEHPSKQAYIWAKNTNR